MLKNDTLKNGKSCIGLYGSAPPGVQMIPKKLVSIWEGFAYAQAS